MAVIDDKILKKIEDGRQFRRNDLHPEFRALDQEVDSEDMIVEGHATTFDEEYLLFSYDNWDGYRVSIYEKMSRDAFNDTDMSDVIFLYDHAGRVMARNRNGTLTVQPDNTGLFVRGNLKNSDLGPGLYRDIKNGFVDRMSIQFTIAETSREEIRNDEDKTLKVVRTITKVGKLYDVSAVSIPANDGTDISARSAADGVIRELEAERLKEQKRAREIEQLKLRMKLERNK